MVVTPIGGTRHNRPLENLSPTSKVAFAKSAVQSLGMERVMEKSIHDVP